VDCFRSDYDPSCFSLTSQTYQDVVHQIIEPAGHSCDPLIGIVIERFKQHFASFAYFCRFWGCGAYLSSVTELETHETMHSSGIKCAESTCAFSRIGFSSAVALKRHIRTYHPQDINIAAATRTIRRKHVCSGVIDGVAWGCKQRFTVERELHRHIASRQGTSCDQLYMKPQQTTQPTQLLKAEDVRKLRHLSEDQRIKYQPVLAGYWNSMISNAPGSPIHQQARAKLLEWSQKLITQERKYRTRIKQQ
jgi:hypothetical protein